MGKVNVKRIYNAAEKSDGFRILVDRLWPRGISKERAKLDLWLKEIAPSTELRQWYHGDEGAGKWEEFKARYIAELKNNTTVAQLLELIKEKEVITLLYSVSDEEHNHALLLSDFVANNA